MSVAPRPGHVWCPQASTGLFRGHNTASVGSLVLRSLSPGSPVSWVPHPSSSLWPQPLASGVAGLGPFRPHPQLYPHQPLPLFLSASLTPATTPAMLTQNPSWAPIPSWACSLPVMSCSPSNGSPGKLPHPFLSRVWVEVVVAKGILGR